MNARFRCKGLDAQSQQMVNNEIRKQLTRLAENNAACFDAIVLLLLYKNLGFRKKRLRKFYDDYEALEKELAHYYGTTPMTKGGQFDFTFCALEELKKIGVDVEYWREQKKNWKPENDQCWNEH